MSSKGKGKRALRRVFLSALISLALLILSVGILFAIEINKVDAPLDEALFLSSGEGGARYYCSDRPYSLPEEYSPSLIFTDINRDEVRLACNLTDIPEAIRLGFIATEDRKFYSHKGVDVKRTALALLNYLFHFDEEFGASTITQQLIKNISGENERTLKRKFTELARAICIEERHSKDEILLAYINIVPMGENAYGIGAGAYTYFDKSPSELTLAECAMLVGITNSPSRLNPYKDYGACLSRRNDVLFCMRECGYIDDVAYESAINSPLTVIKRREGEQRHANWFFETAREDAVAIISRELDVSPARARLLLNSGGLHIYTTQDSKIQAVLESCFENDGLLKTEREAGLEVSFTVCDSQNGRLLGIIGSLGKKTSDRLVNHATVPHTPGSALKPLALYAPLIDRKIIIPATVFDDVPISFDGGRAYPKNYPNQYSGLITVRDALKYSKNTVAMRLYSILGAEKIFRSLREDFGFDTLTEGKEGKTDLAIAPLALGQLTYGVTPRALTEAYTVLANEGVRVRPTSIIAIYTKDGVPIYEYKPEPRRIFSSEGARLMTQLLTNVVKEGTARSLTLKNYYDTAGKTGTSGEDRDRVFVGYTPYYPAGIWMGYANSDRAIGKTSVGHLEIWDTVMKEIHRATLSDLDDYKLRHFSLKGLKKCSFCRDSGMFLSQRREYDCRGSREMSEYFISGTEPSGECNRHILVLYDKSTEALANKRCPRENLVPIALIRVEDRSFPYELTVEDGGYVYRKMREGIYTEDSELPYFYGELEPNTYAGKSRGRQKNRYCQEH